MMAPLLEEFVQVGDGATSQLGLVQLAFLRKGLGGLLQADLIEEAEDRLELINRQSFRKLVQHPSNQDVSRLSS